MIKNILERYYKFSYRVETLPSPLVFTIGLIFAIVISPLVLISYWLDLLIEKISGRKDISKIPRGWILTWYYTLGLIGVVTIYNILFTVVLVIIVESYLNSETQID